MDLEDAEVVLDVEVAGELIFRLLQIVDKTHLDVSYQIIQRAWNDETKQLWRTDSGRTRWHVER